MWNSDINLWILYYILLWHMWVLKMQIYVLWQIIFRNNGGDVYSDVNLRGFYAFILQ